VVGEASGGEEKDVGEDEKLKLEKEARQRRAELEERMTARAAELLGRALAASGQPLAALLALHRCTQLRSQRRVTALVQFQHLRDSMQRTLASAAAIVAEHASGESDGEEGGPHWPIRVTTTTMRTTTTTTATTEDGEAVAGTQGVLVATEGISEGDEVLVEKPFLTAPWPTPQTMYCAHCLRRLPEEGAGASTWSAAAEVARRYCSPICEAAAWLVHDQLSEQEPASGPNDSTTHSVVAGDEEGHCLLLLAKRIVACLSHDAGKAALQPVWSLIESIIQSLPGPTVMTTEEGDSRGEAQLQSLPDSCQRQEEGSAGEGCDALRLVARLRANVLQVPEGCGTSNSGESNVGCRGLALFLLGSRVGWSPQPNVKIVFGDADATLRLVALRAIAANEPLTAQHP
jgi:hypothetical protein